MFDVIFSGNQTEQSSSPELTIHSCQNSRAASALVFHHGFVHLTPHQEAIPGHPLPVPDENWVFLRGHSSWRKETQCYHHVDNQGAPLQLTPARTGTALQGIQTQIKNFSILSALPSLHVTFTRETPTFPQPWGAIPWQRVKNHRSKDSKGPSDLLSASDFYEQPNGIKRPNNEQFLSETNHLHKLATKW